MKTIKVIYASIFTLFILAETITAQNVTSLQTASGNIEKKMLEAFELGDEYNNFWIAYSISTEKENQICMGHFYYGGDFDNISLRDVIENNLKFQKFQKQNDDKELKRHTMRVINGRMSSDKFVDKEVAILFRYDASSKSLDDFAEISICNLSYYIELRNYPLFWLGESKNKPSHMFLTKMYGNTKSDFAKKELIAGIAIHTEQPEVTSFLSDVLQNESDSEIREEIPFWLGYQDNDKAFRILKDLVYNDPDDKMREEAIMGIGQLTSNAATDELIKIAKRNPDRELREDAILWLGQKAVKKAEAALKDFVENDPDIDIKKRAVYALANNSDDHIEYLAQLAKSHNSLAIRKCAIYSLGNSDDEKALDVLIDLLNN